jgi:hypothetical protein
VMAPWSTELDVARFAGRLAPGRIIPVHDGYAKDFFLESRYGNFDKYFASIGIGFEWMSNPGDLIEIE